MLVRNTLDDKILLRLGKIFEDKHWKMENDEYGEISVFDRFCERLAELDNNEDRELMLDLTEKYMVVGMDQYEKCLIEAFGKFISDRKGLLQDIDVIHVFPIQDKECLGKTKSGNMMCYLTQGIVLRRFKEFHDKRVRIIETYDGIKKHKNSIQLLLLIDDYIGSGDTALGCINLLEEQGIGKEKIIVISLVTQNAGKEVIEDYGVNVYFSIERNKGITDNYTAGEAETKIEQMKRIGKKIKADKDLYLGYKDSEGLISTLKTPNNTFPFYWFEKKKKGKFTYAPFPRRGNVATEE